MTLDPLDCFFVEAKGLVAGVGRQRFGAVRGPELGQKSCVKSCLCLNKCVPGVSKGCCLEVFNYFPGLPKSSRHLCNPWFVFMFK